jgi:hypothetical protein
MNVSVGGVTVSGGKIANASQVAAGMAAGFRRCLNSALARDPGSIKGGSTLRVTAQVGKDGEVLSSTPSGGAGLSASAIACIAARVSSAQLAPPDGGNATLVIPLSVQVNP